MKKFLLVLVAVLFVLSGCSKAPADDSTDTNTDPAPVTYKAGMGSVSSFSNSDVEDGEDGSIEHDTTVCALVVDSEGKIVAVTFNTSQIRGTISGEDATVTLTDDLRTKREKKFDYGMKDTSASKGVIAEGGEWFEQVDALEAALVGKNVADIDSLVSEGEFSDADLVAGCTIHTYDFVNSLKKAVANLVDIGESYESLKTGMIASHKVSEKDEDGTPIEIDVTMCLAVEANGVLSHVVFDVAQDKMTVDAEGVCETPTELPTKREKLEAYGMKETSASKGVIEGGAEWYEQADNLAAGLVGKTLADACATELTEDTYLVDADLFAGCTIHASDFIKVLNEAAANDWAK